MKPKSLEECKNEVAKEHGFESWFHVLSKRLYRLEEVDSLINEAAELYARSVWDAACEAQQLMYFDSADDKKPEYNPL